MKLDKVEIHNYKSIVRVEVDLGQSDNILSLIGQNESGKSSILEALRDFYNGEFDGDSYPYESPAGLDQVVSCQFSFEAADDKPAILDEIENFANEEIFKEVVAFKPNTISRISNFTLTFDGKNYSLDTTFQNALINNLEVESTGAASVEAEEDADENEEEFDASILTPDVGKFIVDNIIPEFIFFEGGTCDTLPDFISIDDLVEETGDGWVSVTWLEACLQELTGNADFTFKSLAETPSIRRLDETNKRISDITADLKNDFSQKLHGIENDKLGLVFNIEKRKEKEDEVEKNYIDFAVRTKEGKELPVRMRSQGMIWFLSFWLALKSLKEKKAIILVDEPDRSLHINAQKDLLKVFEKISGKFGHQILYTTHAPTLVPLETIYRVALVFNDKDQGTLCENILKTQIGNSKNKQEAMSLVNYAIGCDVPHQNLIFKEKNVILEGVSDYMHLQAMAIVLGKKLDYALIPGVGALGSKLNPLVGICIGYNLKWCVVIDGEPVGQAKFDDLKEGIFAGDKTRAEKKVKTLDVSDIEELFSISDIQTIAGGSKNFALAPKPQKKDNVSYIGKSRKNIFAKLFLEKAKKKQIKKDDLSKTTITAFEEIFTFVDQALQEDEFNFS
ncbi:ATP-binding protein [Patescibacteria group bacterium]|nr:ATP-binding protein [Patescibacteria group bacterium]MBU1500456.1 ATP-binding protein [Patescibacteria group bacterium]MBU2080746.1 ATP-binding protein [Patescibacteria group bacterium]MBU2123851.1 ATP-binding protein [Patescibacteria group bacterium]MBU2194858.1 ATP-binding protein [Patescibacteria group bacterium]